MSEWLLAVFFFALGGPLLSELEKKKSWIWCWVDFVNLDFVWVLCYCEAACDFNIHALGHVCVCVRVCAAPPTGCQVSGPWDSAAMDGLSELVQDLRLCSQGLNQLDRQALKQSWGDPRGLFLDRNSKCLLSSAVSAWRGGKMRRGCGVTAALHHWHLIF